MKTIIDNTPAPPVEVSRFVSLPNYAGAPDVDGPLAEELDLAGITVERLPEVCRTKGEVKTIIIGELHGWVFKRAWRYWVCDGPGIPLAEATALHEAFGKQVRVDGHCGCPSPLEWFKGLGTGSYHVDTLRGLKALADTIQEVVSKANNPLHRAGRCHHGCAPACNGEAETNHASKNQTTV